MNCLPINRNLPSATRTLASCALALLLVFGSGCRPPSTGPFANSPALFDFSGNGNRGTGSSLFGKNSQFAGANLLGGMGNPLNPNQRNGIQANSPEQYQQYTELADQLRTMNQRVSAYDSDNQQLNTELAAQRQKLQLANQYSQTLKDQLADTSGQVRQAQVQRQSALQELAAMQLKLQQANQNQQALAQQQNQQPGQLAGFSGGVPSRLAGTATLRANNSLLGGLSQIQIPGGEARMDGDVIRIEFPSDRLFSPGTYQVQPAQLPMLRNLVGTIQRNFPSQIVGIEGHWDGTPLSPSGVSDHQLTATQSLAVSDQLIQLGLPRKQLFTMAMASNRPRHSQSANGGISPNRRVEVVIYPEKYSDR